MSSKWVEEFELVFIEHLHRFDDYVTPFVATEVDVELVQEIAKYLLDVEELEVSYKEDPMEILRIAGFIYGYIKEKEGD